MADISAVVKKLLEIQGSNIIEANNLQETNNSSIFLKLILDPIREYDNYSILKEKYELIKNTDISILGFKINLIKIV